MDFHSVFTSRCLVTDGAMGTYYREKYGEGAGVPELDNLKNPERIRKIHREYIEAGADIIRTNSFASNIQTLCRDTSDRTREEQLSVVYQNVSAACRIAQSAVEEQERIQGKETEIYIAGDIGPIPEQGGDDEKTRNITEEYKTMAKAHLDAGVRLIWFETFSDLERILRFYHDRFLAKYVRLYKERREHE